jgi:hypothetical protein
MFSCLGVATTLVKDYLLSKDMKEAGPFMSASRVGNIRIKGAPGSRKPEAHIADAESYSVVTDLCADVIADSIESHDVSTNSKFN